MEIEQESLPPPPAELSQFMLLLVASSLYQITEEPIF